MILPADLLNKLRRSRFLLPNPRTFQGIGERRSQKNGSGMEFSDYRTYEVGDDLRHLDPYIWARTGDYVIRQYRVEEPLQISIVLDASASMNIGHPNKYQFARELVAALSFVGLAGGDFVQILACHDGRLLSSPLLQGINRADVLFHWLENLSPAGANLGQSLISLNNNCSFRKLMLVVSDFWWADLDRDLKTLLRNRSDLFAMHLLNHEETNPDKIGLGEIQLMDIETNQTVNVDLDETNCHIYRQSLTDWQNNIRNKIQGYQGKYMTVLSNSSLDDLFLRTFRQQGLIS